MKISEFIEKNRSFAVMLLILFAARWSLADHYRVPSGSMLPNVHVGDHILVNKTAYDLRLPFTSMSLWRTAEPQRGDVVVFIWPGDQSTRFVKRLIGLPGDHLQIENGFVTVNGQSLGRVSLDFASGVQTYSEHLSTGDYQVQRLPLRAHEERLEFVVPKDSYFFMGDNRDDSLDSRAWGFVQRKALIGKAGRVLFNLAFENGMPKAEASRILSPL